MQRVSVVESGRRYEGDWVVEGDQVVVRTIEGEDGTQLGGLEGYPEMLASRCLRNLIRASKAGSGVPVDEA